MKLEVLQKNYCYHIYNRGINGENIYLNNENNMYFLKLYRKYLAESVSTFAYCLLNNHFHIVIRLEKESKETTRDFSNFFNAYVKAFNKAHKRTGSLFEKHFKRIQLKDESYLKQLILYVHLNPKIHFGADFENYMFSSYRSILSDKETLLKREEVLALFEDRENFRFVHQFKNSEIEEKYKLE